MQQRIIQQLWQRSKHRITKPSCHASTAARQHSAQHASRRLLCCCRGQLLCECQACCS
jgi:hypothetical protein